MNQRQQDELDALSAIYPSFITITPTSGTRTIVYLKPDYFDLGVLTPFRVSSPRPPPPPRQATSSRKKLIRHTVKEKYVRPEAVVLRLGRSRGEDPPSVELLRPTMPPLKTPTLTVDEDKEDEELVVELQYLPPIGLSVNLPDGYPETAAPNIEVTEKTGWLDAEMLKTVEEELNGVWDRSECLFDLLTLLPSLIRPPPSLPSLSPFLTFHNTQLDTSFSLQTQHCGVCLSLRKGHLCTQLPRCGHVFCSSCLHDYFSLLIVEGSISNIKCPDMDCGMALTPEDVGELVGEDMMTRWKKLKEKQRIEMEPGVSICPRPSCQGLVPKPATEGENGEEEDDEDQKLRICPTCTYSFCVVCRKGWHGNTNPCSRHLASALIELYLSSSNAEQLALARKYGRKHLAKLVSDWETEEFNRKWLEENSTTCPGCKVNVEKSAGCNHMTCARCKQHFCFRCGDKLVPSNPYSHFSVPGQSNCYNKLFDFVPGNEPPPEEWVGMLLD